VNLLDWREGLNRITNQGERRAAATWIGGDTATLSQQWWPHKVIQETTCLARLCWLMPVILTEDPQLEG
jgi:hypothetical protein